MAYGIEIKERTFTDESECEKIVDVLDNECPRYIRYRWRNDLIVWGQDVDELTERQAEKIANLLEKANIDYEIYQID